MINRDYKSGKIIEIIREWDNTGDKYEINGIDKSLAVPFFRYEYEKFKVIPKGSYKYIAENNNEFLVITNPDILANATQFQIVYVYSQESSKYIEDFPDISILKEKYNQLVEDTTNIFGYLKSVGLIADTEQMTQVLTQLRPLETWYMNAEGEIDSLPVSEFSEKLKEVIQKIYEDILSKITTDYEELSKKLATQTQEELAILQAKFETLEGLLDTFTKLKLTEISEFTQQKIEEIQKVCDELIAITTHKLDKVDTIEQLKQATWVKLGDIVEVLGYYEKSDGATHKRVISDVDDGSGVQLANGLWANILHNGEVNVSWFGAKGDGVTDDTLAIKKASLYDVVNFDNKIYIFSKTFFLKSGQIINGNGATIDVQSGEDNAVFNGKGDVETVDNLLIKDLTILVNRKTTHGIYISGGKGGKNINIDNIVVYNPLYDGICVHGYYNYVNEYQEAWAYDNFFLVKITNCKCFNEKLTQKTRTGFMIENQDKAILNNCYATGFHTGLHIEGSSNVLISNSIFEDNCYPNQESSNYAGDLLVGRGINLHFSNCVFKRTNQDFEVTDKDLGTFDYRNAYIASKYHKNIQFSSCTFYKGSVKCDEGGATEPSIHDVTIFNSCYFLEGGVMVYPKNGLFNQLLISESIFNEFALNLVNITEFNISNNIFKNKTTAPITLNTCSSGLINSNKFKGGRESGGSIETRNSQLVLSGGNTISVIGNSFVTDKNFKAKYAIGINSFKNLLLSDNTFYKTENFAVIKELYNYWSTNVTFRNNVISYTDTAFTNYSSVTDSNKKLFVGNLINWKEDVTTKLNTPLMFTRMEKRGVKEDYINYMDEKEEFEKQQAKLAEQQAHPKARRKRSVMIQLREPKPSEKLQEFIDEFL